mmetsp:Transcript_37385/g.112860  ORF Transcript_37385/g.112860 Transcript_37385/m.112860 type:complete len:238 (-) Transcript_37385:1322-2035(-)
MPHLTPEMPRGQGLHATAENRLPERGPLPGAQTSAGRRDVCCATGRGQAALAASSAYFCSVRTLATRAACHWEAWDACHCACALCAICHCAACAICHCAAWAICHWAACAICHWAACHWAACLWAASATAAAWAACAVRADRNACSSDRPSAASWTPRSCSKLSSATAAAGVAVASTSASASAPPTAAASASASASASAGSGSAACSDGVGTCLGLESRTASDASAGSTRLTAVLAA